MEEIANATSTDNRPKPKLKTRGARRHYERRLPVRVRQDEIELLRLRANQAGLSLSRYVVLSALAGKAIAPEDQHYTERRLELLQAAIEEVSRVGNNVNQIARQLNVQTGTVSSSVVQQTLNAVDEALNSLRQLWDKQEASSS